jgi:hypothetical protein
MNSEKIEMKNKIYFITTFKFRWLTRSIHNYSLFIFHC